MIQTIAQVVLLLWLSGSFVMGIRMHGKMMRRPFNGYVMSALAVGELAVIFLAGGFS